MESEHMEKENKKTIEEMFSEIEQTLAKLESADVTLEDSFRFYEDGMKQIKCCTDALTQAEKRMQILLASGETEDF